MKRNKAYNKISELLAHPLVKYVRATDFRADVFDFVYQDDIGRLVVVPVDAVYTTYPRRLNKEFIDNAIDYNTIVPLFTQGIYVGTLEQLHSRLLTDSVGTNSDNATIKDLLELIEIIQVDHLKSKEIPIDFTCKSFTQHILAGFFVIGIIQIGYWAFLLIKYINN